MFCISRTSVNDLNWLVILRNFLKSIVFARILLRVSGENVKIFSRIRDAPYKSLIRIGVPKRQLSSILLGK